MSHRAARHRLNTDTEMLLCNMWSVFVVRSVDNTMPTELELNRVINNIQELLYSASDVSHDRCVKVLTARAKVRPPAAKGAICKISPQV